MSVFPEYDEIKKLIDLWIPFGKVESLAEIVDHQSKYSLHRFSLGSDHPEAPSLILTGGVHGLERIGSQVALSFMQHLVARLPWDESLNEQLSKMRITFVPLVNPAGMHRFKRSNGNGVDLMRNSPVVAENPNWGVGGQSYSKNFPWFRGNPEKTLEGMESESKAVAKLVIQEIKHSKCTIALDLHSGFGVSDQLWFPYAKTKEVFSEIHQVHAFSKILDAVMPNHVYVFEPQSKNYTTHGDLWDYLYDQKPKENTFLPLTLEMGSWNWVKKNPLQLFSFLGAFNPVKPHRQKRAMRRHLPLFDFLMHATTSHQHWSQAEVEQNRISGIQKWYRSIQK